MRSEKNNDCPVVCIVKESDELMKEKCPTCVHNKKASDPKEDIPETLRQTGY